MQVLWFYYFNNSHGKRFFSESMEVATEFLRIISVLAAIRRTKGKLWERSLGLSRCSRWCMIENGV